MAADIDDTLPEWSATESSNKPSGTTSVSTNLDDNLRMVQKVVRGWLASKGSDIASASTTDLGAVEGLMHDITGNTTITSFGTVAAGILKVIKFEGALTLTHNSTSLILPTAENITTADGDIAIVISEGSGNWRCVSYMRATGSHLGPVGATSQATTSGSSVDFTVPSWAKKITVQVNGISVAGATGPSVQLGDSGGVENTGYSGAALLQANGATAVVSANSSGFLFGGAAATYVYYGQIFLTLEDSSSFTWSCSGTLSAATGPTVFCLSGAKALSAALTTVRVNSGGTFDAGSVNVIYE